MQNIKTNRSNKKIILAVIAIVILAGVAYTAAAYTLNYYPFAQPEQTTEVQDTPSDTGTKKQELIENGGTTEYNGAPPTESDSIELTATQVGDTVTVATKLHDYSDGTCSLLIRSSEKTETNTVPVIYQSEYATCAGFSVDTATYGKGSWNIELTVTSKGISRTKVTSINVD